MYDLIDELCRILDQDRPLVLATVLSHQGSTPRGAGSRMLILSGGEIIGTIGGGSMEADVMQRAQDLFEAQSSEIRAYDLTAQPGLDKLDVICGGQMQVLIEYIHASHENKLVFKRLQNALKQGQSCFMIAAIEETETRLRVGTRQFVSSQGHLTGDEGYPASDVHDLIAQIKDPHVPVLQTINNTTYLIEPYGIAKSVYIFGAGHVAKFVAAICKMVHFRTAVLDDREEFANHSRFPTADQVIVLSTFEKAMQALSIDANSFIVIVTRGHRHDQTILTQALQTDATYIGMIGSRKKRDAIYANLLNSGFVQADINRVHSPIGLEIAAETPEEIAVSIAAEMILHRAKT
jgi:xanthine dehydrogenase accessory factor